jgi:hypothetical protein
MDIDIVDFYLKDLEQIAIKLGDEIAEDIYERCKTFNNVEDYYEFSKAGWEINNYFNCLYCATCLIKARTIYHYEDPFVLHAALSPNCEYIKLWNVNISQVDVNEIKKDMLIL